MKKIILIILTILITISSSSIVFAEGDGNIDGGGGEMGGGTKTNICHIGHDGVRITIIKDSTNKPVSNSIDFSNINTNNIKIW